ncbi:MAG TPA: hypothetical protein VHM24_01950 [Gemmatimonadaceae bacterium]|nr:hypothetical protein [Gemmatimonadaceae bacterium]
MLKNFRYPSLFAVVSIVVIAATVSGSRFAAKPSRYVYVWAGTGGKKTTGISSLVVIDADPKSAKYGTVIEAVTVDSAGSSPHHTEFELPRSGPYFVSDYGASKAFMIDFSNPAKPRSAGQTAPPPTGHMMHSFARTPQGNVLATVQHGDMSVEGHPGGLVELNGAGKVVRYASSQDPAFPGAHIRTYAVTTLPKIDRIVTTSSPMDDEVTADVVQVWRMSDLKLLKTMPVPQIAGDSTHRYPFEVRTLADGKTVMLNTYYCGFFTITGIEKDPKVERVMTLPQPGNIGCAVPIIAGKFMLMPIAYGHRYATIDISNPARPVEVSSVAMDSTFFPHWIARDPNSDRIIVTDQGDGPPMVMLGRFDAKTGKLTWDERFKDPGASKPGVSFLNVNWPNGVKGKATPHGAVFVP